MQYLNHITGNQQNVLYFEAFDKFMDGVTDRFQQSFYCTKTSMVYLLSSVIEMIITSRSVKLLIWMANSLKKLLTCAILIKNQ